MTTNERIRLLDLAQRKLNEAHDLVQTATNGTEVGGEIYHELRALLTIRTADGRMAKRDIAYLQQRLRDAEPTAEVPTIRVTGVTVALASPFRLFEGLDLDSDPTFDPIESTERVRRILEETLRAAFDTNDVVVEKSEEYRTEVYARTAPKSIADALTEPEMRAVVDAWNHAAEKVHAIQTTILDHPLEGDEPEAWVVRCPARW